AILSTEAYCIRHSNRRRFYHCRRPREKTARLTESGAVLSFRPRGNIGLQLWNLAHYRATEPTVNRPDPSSLALAHTVSAYGPWRLTAFGRDLDSRFACCRHEKGCAPCPPPPGPISAKSARHGRRPILHRCGRR